ncbi:MAG: lyase family protein [Nanoarchaeota archaeon]|nr:lyase family protein [Nanoarchaeota archaeon]
MEIEKIFTKQNLRILHILEQGPSHLREIADKLKISPAKVHGAITLFSKHNLINEQKEKNRRVITLNTKSDLIQGLDQMLSKKETNRDTNINLFDTISPLDFRYYGRNEKVKKKLRPYLSEQAFVKYLAKVESALTKTLSEMNICSKEVAAEVEQASKQITAQEVYEEEDRIKHNIRALANAIRNRVSDKAKPYVHFTTTSHDIICSADAARCKDFTLEVLIPALEQLMQSLIHLAQREKQTLQIGRTHGQHAEPITFGFAVAQYVSRLGSRIKQIEKAAKNLRGKIAGAVGAYNASTLFFNDPEDFERKVLAKMGLKASPISTQVVEAEYFADFIHAITSCFGVLANVADDMRNLQRTEISEVAELFESKQVGSSTMPHKRNPINFENVKSMWKEFMPRMTTMYMDQISEHQRDLTNSASQRFVTETLAALYLSTTRLQRTMSKLVVDKPNLEKNFNTHKDMITAEPAYILLAAHGHPDAHEYVRELTLESQKTNTSFSELLFKDKQMKPYLAKFNKTQLAILQKPENYTGIASEKVEKICNFWKKELKI